MSNAGTGPNGHHFFYKKNILYRITSPGPDTCSQDHQLACNHVLFPFVPPAFAEMNHEWDVTLTNPTEHEKNIFLTGDPTARVLTKTDPARRHCRYTSPDG
jgi:hypothetical protein